MTGGRQAQLWGGREDGATVYLPPGELPRQIGVHRTADGQLVPIRARSVLYQELAHVAVYEHVTVELARPVFGQWSCTPALVDGLLYVPRELATRWAAHQ